MGDLEGRRYVVTGSNTGIGRVTALELARRGGEVWLANRSEEKTRPVIDEIVAAGGRARFVPLDLSDLASVRACADRILGETDRLDALINNAGLARAPGSTKQGFEVTFGVNHLGHFLLTNRLLPALEKAASEHAPARIVNVSSRGHYRASRFDWDALRKPTRSYTGLPEYNVSKLANVLFTKELARRLGTGKVHAYALHPGVVASDVWRGVPWPFQGLIKRFMISNEEGARTTLYCATSPECAGATGRYYDLCREKTPNPVSEDAALAKELWAKSEAWTAPFSA